MRFAPQPLVLAAAAVGLAVLGWLAAEPPAQPQVRLLQAGRPASAAAGFARAVGNAPRADASPTMAHPRPAEPPLAASHPAESMWTQLAADKDQHRVGSPLHDRLRLAARDDPGAMAFLLARFEREREPSVRQLLKDILGGLDSPQLFAFALRMAASSSPQQKQDGFELLKERGGETAQARALVLQALAIDQDPATVSRAVAALQPTEDVQARAEVASRLRQLGLQHPDADVRAESLLQLHPWGAAADTERTLLQALADPSAAVRQAAIVALSQFPRRPPAARAALQDLASRGGESPAVRASALHLLEQDELSEEKF